MLSLLQSSVFVHALLLLMLLAWLAGSVAMMVGDARDSQRRLTGQPEYDSSPAIPSPAEASFSETSSAANLAPVGSPAGWTAMLQSLNWVRRTQAEPAGRAQ